VGATRTPELFCCAVDLCGPSDLRSLLAGIPPYWDSLRALWTARVGDPERDAALLAERSPLTRADRIRVPLFVAQGVNDPRVPRREAEQLVAALTVAGVEHEYLALPGGHLTFELDVELALVARIERFLARHLGGRVEEGA
jgi:dipeptidyl aminopeptidase/acylaminoacyl peptidase